MQGCFKMDPPFYNKIDCEKAFSLFCNQNESNKAILLYTKS